MSGSVTKMLLDDDLSTRKGIASTLNYSRDQLLEFGQCKAAKEPPKMFDFSGADDKRIEKIRHVLKNSDIWKSLNKNGETVTSKGGVAENTEQVRTNFQQMISAAVSNAHQQNAESAANRRRIGSGRIPESNYNVRDNIYGIGMDARYMRDKLFKDDGKIGKNWKSSIDTKWNHADDNDNADAKSDEPEWANCGPISKHDIIELHGFDGPEDDDTQKADNAMPSPPARNSTPSKLGSKKVTSDDHFNFEDFLKLDLPPSVNCSRDVGTGESRFSQWFGRDKPSHTGNKFTGSALDVKSAQQFFDYHQKANQKKMNAPNKLRSVNELEADWAKPKEAKPQVQPDINTIRNILNHLATQSTVQKQRAMTSDQTNFLLSLINKRAENLYQYRLSQNAIMKRPDAQLLLHRLVNGETTQLHILQQLSNLTIHQRDRETLLAVFNFCNENQQWLLQQQEQQKKHKEQMSQQFRQLQMIHMKSGNMQPTAQELQFHTQNIMQNALYKKQIEDQYRGLQNLKTAPSSKFSSFKTNNAYISGEQNNRYNHKQKQNFYGQNGLQFIQNNSQNKSLWNRQAQTNATFLGGSGVGGSRNANDLLAATMPAFAKFDVTMPMANDKVPIAVEK